MAVRPMTLLMSATNKQEGKVVCKHVLLKNNLHFLLRKQFALAETYEQLINIKANKICNSEIIFTSYRNILYRSCSECRALEPTMTEFSVSYNTINRYYKFLT